LMSSIPADVRRDIRRSLKDARPAIRATMRQAGEQRQVLAIALAITPYDSMAVGQAFDNMVESYEELIPPARRIFLSAIEKLDDEDRLKASEALANMDFHKRRGWPRHWRREW
ncbi:MAG: periplasmic heavy metal sensor, partial [Parvularculales bacterium]